MNNKKSIIALLLIAIIGIVGLTIAYFANNTDIENIFTTKEYGTEYTETFVSPNNWLPGDTTTKTLEVENTGEVDEAVRISLVQVWESANGDELPLSKNGVTAAIINLANKRYWKLDNGYYYYKYKLAPGETTRSFLDSVTFNPDFTLDNTCTETLNGNTRTITCNSSGDDYDNATYTLTFNIETVQYNQYKNAWNTNFDIAPELPTSGTNSVLTKTNNENVTNYTDGDIHQMFTFNHESTTQTEEVADYRYIGDDPYNYVYFNCTDDDDVSTCEIWRIIGVFEVEDENGNKVERMKIVRNSVLSGSYPWNSAYANTWSSASLKTYLNADYLSSMSESAKEMIGTTKFYLGSVTSTETSTDNLYVTERSGSSNWVGSIALVYPSDIYYTYANNVSNDCYELNCMCSMQYAQVDVCKPKASWIYLYPDIWTLNPDGSAWNACNGMHIGDLNGGNCSWNYQVRPTLYLKENVKIASGTGMSSDPYILSE